MSKWRKKSMPLEEWAPLQDRFGELQMVMRGHPDLAMFVDGPPWEDNSDIYITGPKIEIIEAFSPGGWEDSNKPHSEHVALLVGTSDSFERHGVTLPSILRER